MAHQIEKPWDRVFSTVGTEWHGLAEKKETIDRETLKPLFAPIVEGEIVVQLGGETVKLEDKAIVADYRFRDDIPEGQRIRPLSVMGKDYRVINNEEIFGAVEEAIETQNLDAEIITGGTLRGGKVFFLSLGQKDSTVEIVKDDPWSFLLAIVTSHDGQFALTPYLTGTRPVCMNTVRSGLESSELKCSIYHTRNASLQLRSFPELLVAMKKRQVETVEALTHLAGIRCDNNLATRIVSGYFVMTQPVGTPREGLSTRAKNAVEGIVNLSATGRGNKGETMYDLLNGFTDYYTNGDGTGRNSDADSKLFKANMGSAADRKTEFISLLSDSDRRSQMAKIGKEVLSF